MREKQKVPLGYQEGLISEATPTDLTAGSPNLYNVYLSRGVMQRTPGVRVPADPIDPIGEAILAAEDYYVDEVWQYQLVVTPTRLIKLAGTSWVKLADFDASELSYVSIHRHLNLMIIVGDTLAPAQWDGTNLTTLTGLTNVRAAGSEDYYSHTFLFDVTEIGIRSRTRLQWSDTGNPNEWVTGNAGFVDLLETPGAILGIKPLLDRLIIYKEDSIWEAVYVGTGTVFKVYPTVLGIGCASSRAIASAENSHIFMAQDGVYQTDGRDFTLISSNIRSLLTGANALIDRTLLKYVRGTFISDYNEYWLAIPTSGTEYSDVILIYQLDTKTWWSKTLDDVQFIGTALVTIAASWLDMLETWPANQYRWNAPLYDNTSRMISIGTSTGVEEISYGVVTDYGVYVDAVWESKDFNLGWSSRWLSLTMEVSGAPGVTASLSTDEGVTWTLLGWKAGGATSYTKTSWDFNITTETMRFKLELGQGDVRIRNMLAYAVQRTGDR